MLLDRIINYSDYMNLRRALSKEMSRFAWENSIDQYDLELEKLPA